jgi:nucleotidyltransferase substrate binding protein (TIGR01987 family)
MENKDIRWIQRFNNYCKALSQLENAVLLSKERELSNLEEQGLIQSFEYTHELAWKTLKDFLNDKGNNEIYGSKDATREAFKYDLIINGEIWMDMISSRNKTSHTYNEETANSIVLAIITDYYQEFINLKNKLIKFIPSK